MFFWVIQIEFSIKFLDSHFKVFILKFKQVFIIISFKDFPSHKPRNYLQLHSFLHSPYAYSPFCQVEISKAFPTDGAFTCTLLMFEQPCYHFSTASNLLFPQPNPLHHCLIPVIDSVNQHVLCSFFCFCFCSSGDWIEELHMLHRHSVTQLHS